MKPKKVNRNPFGVAHLFESEQWVAVPLERVVRFFANPANLSVISPPSSGARLKSLRLIPPDLTQVAGYERMAGAGSEIELSVRVLPYFPLRSSWTARIVEFEWLDHFRDVQASGPFKRFDHTHSFRAEKRNGVAGTLIRDHVEYEIGFGPLGAIANVLMVKLLLEQMFTYRHAATERELGG